MSVFICLSHIQVSAIEFKSLSRNLASQSTAARNLTYLLRTYQALIETGESWLAWVLFFWSNSDRYSPGIPAKILTNVFPGYSVAGRYYPESQTNFFECQIQVIIRKINK